MKNKLSVVLSLVFVLGLGQIAFAQETNTGTMTSNTTTSTKMTHGRGHRKHAKHRRHRRGGKMMSDNMSGGNMSGDKMGGKMNANNSNH